MHDLITIDALPPGSLTVAEIDATMAYAEAEKALATRAAYASDCRDFAAYLSGPADVQPEAVKRRSAVNQTYRRPSRSQPPP